MKVIRGAQSKMPYMLMSLKESRKYGWIFYDHHSIKGDDFVVYQLPEIRP